MLDKTILLALNNSDFLEEALACSTKVGYLPYVARTEEELRKLGCERKYGAYFMDINFPHPTTTDIKNVLAIWENEKARVEQGEARFCTITGWAAAFKLGEQMGIPVREKTGSFNFIRELP